MARTVIIDNQFFQLNGQHSTVVIGCRDGYAAILYWGKKLNSDTPLNQIDMLSKRDEAPASPQCEVALSLCPSLGAGFHGHPGISLSGVGSLWSFVPLVARIEQDGKQKVIVECGEATSPLKLIHMLRLDDNDILSVQTRIVNQGSETCDVDWCAALTFPISQRCSHLTTFSGQWADEFRLLEAKTIDQTYVRENRRGRTSHDCFPGLVLYPQHTTESMGSCYGFHLAWSGNHKTVLERLSDGRAYLQMGELLLPGEIQLSPGQVYESPVLHASFSNNGFSSLSQNFHRYATAQLKPNFKPVVGFNTWEAVYFDHKPDAMLSLIAEAADLGCERFVLDDGWFLGRRHDRAGLGDWQVDETIYPKGLETLIDHAKSKGMEFGLWIEPEMVNPDSHLYRSHPNWVIGTPDNPNVEFRHQRVLDFSQPEIYDNILGKIKALLTRYDIRYLKWDMNRDINQPGSATTVNTPCVNQHVKAVYRMLAELNAQFPKVQIESCASGGGRIDYGILPYVQRFWTSDATDAIDRLSIQRGYSFFFPLALMGSHIGPSPSPITKRRLSMSLRAGVAFWGQLGVEFDPRKLSDADRSELKKAVNLHKKFRPLLHEGDFIRLHASTESQSFGVISKDKSEAVFSFFQITSCRQSVPPKICFRGLCENANYRMKVLWKSESIEENSAALSAISSHSISSQLLEEFGLQLPRMTAESLITFHLEKTE